MSVHVVWESAGQGRQKEEEEQRQQQASDLLCTYGCAAVRCVGASSHCSERVEERLLTTLVAGTTALFSCLGGDCT